MCVKYVEIVNGIEHFQATTKMKLGEIAIGEMDKDSLAVSMCKMKTTESIYLLFSIEFKWIKWIEIQDASHCV